MSESKFDKSGNPKADGYRIVILERGPFMVYGRPPLAEQFIMVNEMNESWYFQEGKHFSTETEPTTLCRCGDSRNKPYCDGRHTSHQWPAETAPETPSPYDTETVEGKTLTMTAGSDEVSVYSKTDIPEEVRAASDALTKASSYGAERFL